MPAQTLQIYNDDHVELHRFIFGAGVIVRKMKSVIAMVTFTAIMAVFLVYQNCSIQNIEAVPGAENITQNKSVTPASQAGDTSTPPDTAGTNTTTDPGSSTGTGTGTGTDPGTSTGGTTSNNSCIKSEGMTGSVMGIAGLPMIQTSYATVAHTAAINAFVPGSTSLTLMSLSQCITRSNLTNPNCSSTSTNNSCTSTPSFTIIVSIKCSSTSDSATNCSDFSVGQEIDLAQDTGFKVSVSASYSPDICRNDNRTYTGAMYPNTRVGKVKIVKDEGLVNGKEFSVDLIGVELVKLGGTEKITVDGRFTGEIITPVTCPSGT